MTIEQIEKVTEQLENLGYYEGDWNISKGQKNNGYEWVYEPCINISNDFLLDDYKRNCDILAGLQIIPLGLTYYII